MLGPRLLGIQAPRTLRDCNNFYPRVKLSYGDTAIVVLTHPSFYYANVGRRRYLDLVGSDAEVGMVRAAITATRLDFVD